MAEKNQFTEGCIVTFMVIIITVIVAFVLSAITSINTTVLYISMFFIINYIINQLLKHILNTKSYKKGRRIGLVIFIILVLTTLLLFELSSEPDYSTPKYDVEENTVFVETITTPSSQTKVLSHNRLWKDYLGQKYTSKFSVRQDDVLRLEPLTSQITYNGKDTFWGDLYAFMSTNNTKSLDLIYVAFETLKETHQLNAKEFADMVVSMVQDIPYALVFEDKCLPPEHYEDDIATILTNCPQCCIGNIAFGVQNPASFMGNLKGDCDTRTVLLYTILSHFGYDVAILNSNFYSHSILGINMPVSGNYKVYKGKKYYVWETLVVNYQKHLIILTIGTLCLQIHNRHEFKIIRPSSF